MRSDHPIRFLAVMFLCLLAGSAAAQETQIPFKGSPYLALDHWAYASFDYMAARGYAPSALLTMKPWTRMECARLVEEGRELLHQQILEDSTARDELAMLMLTRLESEFAPELEILGGGPARQIRLESLYVRVVGVGGNPLNDGYHFGQTIADDFGRPLRRNYNAITGGSIYAYAGPFVVHMRAESQFGSSAPPLSDRVLDVIALRDQIARPTSQALPAIRRLRLLDTYAAINLHNWQLSFGKQSLGWGSGTSGSGSLLLSHNAEPLYMARLSRTIPQKLPGFLRVLGPLKTEFFVSRLQGHRIHAGPIIYGQRISVKPGRIFELSYGRTTILGGGDRPVTFGSVVRSMFGIKRHRPGVPLGFREGDSRNSLDWNWQIPGLSKWLTFYGELYADDDEAGFMNPTKAIYKPGLRIAHLPGISKMDFRIEAVSSESPGRADHHGSLNYWNFDFPDGYTNNGFLMGNTVGRQGRVLQLWSSYWFTPANVLQFAYRHSSVTKEFIPGGGRWDDLAIKHELYLQNGAYVRSRLQFERISEYPTLFAGRAHNVVAAFEVGFMPRERP